jgi:hypothetical protein
MSHKTVLAGLFLALLTGCSLPQWRVFQAKVDPTLAQRPSAQVEAERRAAALIVDLSASPTSNPAARIAEIHSVAVPLSASLGEPLKRATAFEVPAVIAGTQAGIVEAQARAEKWRAFATKYAGRPIEGTGFNLAGPAGLLALAGVVAACIACPALGYLLLRVVPLLWGFFRRTTSAINGYVESHPGQGDALKAALARRMDDAHKVLVRRHAAPAPR